MVLVNKQQQDIIDRDKAGLITLDEGKAEVESYKAPVVEPTAPVSATVDGFTSIKGSDNTYNTTTGEAKDSSGNIISPKTIEAPEQTQAIITPKKEESVLESNTGGFKAISGSDNFYNPTTGEGKMADGTIVPKKTETTPFDNKTGTVAEWKEATGGGLLNLESWVENKYDTVATVKDGKLVATIGDKNYEWTLDGEGNPIKSETDVPVTIRESDDIFNGLVSGEVFDSTTKFTPEYQTAKNMFDTFNGIDKSEEGIKLAIKNGTATPSIIAELNKNPQYAEWVKKANENLIDDRVKEFSAEDAVKANAEEKLNYINYVAGELGFDVDYENEILSDSEMQKNNDLLTSAQEKAIAIKAKIDTVEATIRAKYAGRSPQFINAMVAREKAALTEEYNLEIGEAGLYKQNVDNRLALIEATFQNEQNEAYQKKTIYDDLFKKDWENYTTEETREYEKALAEIEASKTLAQEYAFQNVGDGVMIRTNKTTGDYEFITLDNISPEENIYVPGAGVVNSEGYSLITDELIAKYPNEASVKNNNPAGITNNASAELIQLFEDNGVNWGVGTDRPAAEGGTYIKFNTVEDGLNAYKIALTERGDNVYNRLKSWVGTRSDETNTAYANGILNKAGLEGIDKNTATWDSLTEEQTNLLMAAQMEKESPGFYTEIKKAGILGEDGSLDFETLKTSIGTSVEAGINAPTIGELTLKNGEDLTLVQLGRMAFGEGRAFGEGDKDTARIIVKANPEMTLVDAANKLAGYELGELANNTLGDELISKMRAIYTDKKMPLSNLSALLNKGDEGKAIKSTETYLYSTVNNSETVTEDVVKYTIDRVNELQTKLDAGEKLIGPMEGSLETWLGRLKDEGATDIQGDITRLVAEMRNRLSGTAVTESESLFLEPIIPNLYDRVDALNTKVDKLKNEPLRELNAFRNNLGLPSIDETMVGNVSFDDRVGLYSGEEQKLESFYIDDDGIEYTQESFNTELNRMVKDGEITEEEARTFANSINQ